MKAVKRLLACVLALLLALAASGCGTAEPDTLTVRAALRGAPATLDPARAVTETEKTVVANLFENLMKQTASGVVCAQASRYEYVDNMDGTETYTFTLRNDIRWSDGRKVTARDFVYAWQRLTDPETRSPYASILNMVAGYADAVAGNPDALQVSAPDERTFVVNISGHCSYFLSVVCTAVCTMPVRADAVEPQEEEDGTDGDQADEAVRQDWSMDAATLLTNGPYAVSSLEDGGLTAVAAERYYDVRRLGPRELNFLYVNSTEEAMTLYDAGEVDFVLDAGKTEGAVEASSARVGTVLINQMATTLSEPVRQALSMVIDRNALAQAVAGADEEYRAADGLIPPGITTSDGRSFREANGAVIDNDPETYEERCAAAVDMLRRAGYTQTALEHLSTVTLLYETNAAGSRVAQMLQYTWREKLGIQVDVRGVAPEEMQAALESGEFSLALTAVSADRNTALSYLNRFSSGQKENYGQLYSNAYDMLIRVAANSSSDEARDAYLADAERMLLDSGYVMPLYYETYTWLLRNTLTGLSNDGMGVYYFQSVVKIPS
mgnify:CR=1 FL=1